MTLYKWSQTAALDAGIDGTINWAEGQSPSSINDSARAMMAAISKYRDDCNGGIIATGTASAYAISSNQGFDTLAHLKPQEFTFLCPATNAAGVTLNVDGLGAQAINGTDGVPIPAGTMLNGGIYTVTSYTGEFVLHSVMGQPFNIPIGGCMDYFCPAVPNSSFVFPVGQAISRVTYASLFGLVGTTYGVGDGSTTFNVPDLTGRITAMKEAAASRLTSTYFGGNSTVLGAVGGSESQTLTLAQLPAGITSGGTNSISVLTTLFVLGNTVGNTGSSPGGGTQMTPSDPGSGAVLRRDTSTGSNSINVTSNNTSGTAHPNVQPTIIVNKIFRII